MALGEGAPGRACGETPGLHTFLRTPPGGCSAPAYIHAPRRSQARPAPFTVGRQREAGGIQPGAGGWLEKSAWLRCVPQVVTRPKVWRAACWEASKGRPGLWVWVWWGREVLSALVRTHHRPLSGDLATS